VRPTYDPSRGHWVVKVTLLAASSSWAFSGRSNARTERRSEVRDQRRPRSRECTTCARSANGKIARSPGARRAFQAGHPCPANGETSGACPGYVIDHIKPLKRGGADSPSNMQWQTAAAAKAKDRVE
jgi:hypothetical protein